MTTTAEILKKIRKDHGDNIAKIGGLDFVDVPRIPTGIFPLDLAMGGGWPQGKCCIIYGPESSNKTNVAIKTIVEAQRMWPEKKVVFVDAEHALDLKWATQLGVDTERLIVILPECAEQAVNFIESFIYADDVSLIVLDSIAALITSNELESDAEKAAVGGASLLIGKLYRKVIVSFSKMTNSGATPPTFLAINQIRTKIGVMFGNPETQPGGNPPKFASAMTVRVSGKNIVDPKLSTVVPSFKEVNCVLHKWKAPILGTSAVYSMQMIDAGGNIAGHVSDWTTICAYLKELDYLTKGEKGGWVLSGTHYATQQAAKEALYSDPDLLAELKGLIISELRERGTGFVPTGEIDVEAT
jgi:recombination protein RecA